MLTSSRSKAYSARDTRLRGLLTWWSILEKSISIRSGSSIFRSSQGCQPPTMMTSKTFQSRIRMNLWLIGTQLLTLHLGSLLNVFCHKHPHRHIVWNKIRLWKESLFSANLNQNFKTLYLSKSIRNLSATFRWEKAIKVWVFSLLKTF